MFETIEGKDWVGPVPENMPIRLNRDITEKVKEDSYVITRRTLDNNGAYSLVVSPVKDPDTEFFLTPEDWYVCRDSDRALLSEDFVKGARAFFDVLLGRIANNWSGRPGHDKRCEQENALVEQWAVDALEELSPEDAVEWLCIDAAYHEGFANGKHAGMYIEKRNTTQADGIKGFLHRLIDKMF